MTDPSVWASQAEEARAAYRTRARKEVRARVAVHQLAEDFPVLIEEGRRLSVPEALMAAGIEAD